MVMILVKILILFSIHAVYVPPSHKTFVHNTFSLTGQHLQHQLAKFHHQPVKTFFLILIVFIFLDA